MTTRVRVGYFGGSFDPPHRGHLAVARTARDAFQLERVLLVPTGRQPFKPAGATASFHDRLAMTTLLCAGEPQLEASTLDAPHPDGTPNYTVDALRQLRQQLPSEADIFAIVGADAMASLPHWHDADALLELADWIAVSRPGILYDFDTSETLRTKDRSRLHVLNSVHDPTSATELRERLAQHVRCDDLLPPAVLSFIQEHHLYGA